MGNMKEADEVLEDLFNRTWQRQSGRSTRLIDRYIQDLFTFGTVTVRDHYDNDRNHIILFDRVKKRLKDEHQTVTYSYDITKLTISVLP
jgi:hypothetical protein